MCRATYTGSHHHERFKHTLIELTGRILVMADEMCNDFQMNPWKLAQHQRRWEKENTSDVGRVLVVCDWSASYYERGELYSPGLRRPRHRPQGPVLRDLRTEHGVARIM